MSMEIMIKDKDVFILSGGMFDTICHEFSEIIKNQKLDDDVEIAEFIRAMNFYNETRCPYFDIADFLNTSKGVNMLLDILEQAIKKLQTVFSISAITDLWNFYKELMIYGDELAAQGK